MNAVELRSELHKLIDQLDEPFLKAVHSLISVYQEGKEDAVLGYEGDGTAVTAVEFFKTGQRSGKCGKRRFRNKC